MYHSTRYLFHFYAHNFPNKFFDVSNYLFTTPVLGVVLPLIGTEVVLRDERKHGVIKSTSYLQRLLEAQEIYNKQLLMITGT